MKQHYGLSLGECSIVFFVGLRNAASKETVYPLGKSGCAEGTKFLRLYLEVGGRMFQNIEKILIIKDVILAC